TPRKPKPTGQLEAAETRAEPVSARSPAKSKAASKKKGASDDEIAEPASGKGAPKAARATDGRGTGGRSLPPPPPRGPRPSPQGYLSVDVDMPTSCNSSDRKGGHSRKSRSFAARARRGRGT